ncbi:MAG: radical SAM protein [Chloroflexi bacterium]|nr:radical SAM protein [Chloroflexota bacterium]
MHPAPPSPPDPYDALLGRLRREHVPFTVLWELTHACNLRCVMCYNVPQPEPELTTAERLDVLEQLAAAGTLRLTLTGGEPLMRRDFFAIATRARKLGCALDLKTNATLITPAIADRIAALDPVQVDVSLLGATPATSDAIMDGRNTLPVILQGVRLLRERRVRVKLNTLLLDWNLAERQAMFDMARDLGVYCEQTFKVSPSDVGADIASTRQLSMDQMIEALMADPTSFTPLSPTTDRRTCQVGLASCLISPYGIVYPCIELRIPAGDLRRQRFSEIWAAAAIFRELRSRHLFGNLTDCPACPLSAYCEGRCAGLAWKEHGDLYGGHTLACRHAQARFAQQRPHEPIPNPVFQMRRRDRSSA